MGQYYKKSKIGTCESMYYLRLDMAQKLAERGEKDDDGIAFADYLKANTTRFRFPFPDEDNYTQEKLMMAKYDKGFDLPAGAIEVDHDTICVSNSFDGGFHNVNIFLPCPYSKEFKDMGIKTSTGGPGEQFLTVLFQALRGGKEKTIFACARCGSQQRFSDEDVAKIKERATEYFAPYDRTGKNESYGGNQGLFDYATEIIKRIK